MCAARVVASGWQQKSRWPFGTIAVVVLCGAAWLVKIGGQFQPFADSVFALGFAVLLLAASRDADASSSGLAHRIFNFRPLVGMGAISYSLYLLHTPILDCLIRVFQHRIPRSPINLGWELIVTLVVTFAVCRLFYQFVELPFAGKPKPRLAARPALHVAEEGAPA
jgi:peptidoglycan/LPS O-acetylase OafA/YrhL